MNIRIFLLLISAAAGNLAVASPARAAEDYWRLDPIDAKCFLDHLKLYADAPEDPVVVFLKACPTVDRAEAIQKIQKNSQITQFKETPAKKYDEVIVFSKEELTCLLKNASLTDNEEVLIPAKPTCRP